MEIGLNDNGFYLSSDKKSFNPLKALELVESEKINDIMKNAIDRSEVLKRRFRHCAMRAMMILRSYKGKTKRVGRQQVSSMILLSAVRRISENFPILKEARREVLEDLMDVDNAKKVLQDIEGKKITIKEIETKVPSPFSFNIVLQGVMDILKFEDKQKFLQNMHELVLAKIALSKGRKGEKIKSEDYSDFSYHKMWEEQDEDN